MLPLPGPWMAITRLSLSLNSLVLPFPTRTPLGRLNSRPHSPILGVMSTAASSSKVSPPETKQPPFPRPSASLVIINPRNEVLLVQRNPKASAFGGMQVRSVFLSSSWLGTDVFYSRSSLEVISTRVRMRRLLPLPFAKRLKNQVCCWRLLLAARRRCLRMT